MQNIPRQALQTLRDNNTIQTVLQRQGYLPGVKTTFTVNGHDGAK